MAFLSRENLFTWLDGLKVEYEVFVPFKKGPFRFYQRYSSPDKDIVIGEVRATEPVKGFLHQSKKRWRNFLILSPSEKNRSQQPSSA